MPKTKYLCKICGKEFFRWPQKGHHVPSYCSKSCKSKSQALDSFCWERSTEKQKLERAAHYFKKRVIKSDGCWEFKGAKCRGGYKQMSFNHPKKATRAHIVSWNLYKGKIPKGMLVCHKCDNPGCVNPDHLFLDSHKGNMKDMVKKNRQAKGERHGNSKLTESKVIMIKKLLKSGMSCIELGKAFGVSNTAILYIRTGRNWKHI